jgi:hypothetical protein
MRERGLLLGKGGDVIASVAQLFAFRELDRRISGTRTSAGILRTRLACGSVFGSDFPGLLGQSQCPQASHVLADGNRTLSNLLKSFRSILSRKATPLQPGRLFSGRGFVHHRHWLQNCESSGLVPILTLGVDHETIGQFRDGVTFHPIAHGQGSAGPSISLRSLHNEPPNAIGLRKALAVVNGRQAMPLSDCGPHWR